MERPQVGPRLHAQPLPQTGVRPAVELQRLAVPPAAVECQHQGADHPFRQWALRRQLAQLSDEIGMPAELQLQPDALLPDMAVVLDQPGPHRRRPLAGALGQRFAPPHALGGPQQPDRPVRAALLRRHGRLGAEALEAVQVQIVPVAHPEPVQPGLHQVHPHERSHCVVQVPPQLGEVGLERGRPLGGGSSPQTRSINVSTATGSPRACTRTASTQRCFTEPSVCCWSPCHSSRGPRARRSISLPRQVPCFLPPPAAAARLCGTVHCSLRQPPGPERTGGVSGAHDAALIRPQLERRIPASGLSMSVGRSVPGRHQQRSPRAPVRGDGNGD